MIAAIDNKKETVETKKIDMAFVKQGFKNVESYRYNSVSIRIRVVSEKFEGKSTSEREAMVYPAIIEKLPLSTQQDITFLLLETPAESKKKNSHLDLEFDDPSPSDL